MPEGRRRSRLDGKPEARQKEGSAPGTANAKSRGALTEADLILQNLDELKAREMLLITVEQLVREALSATSLFRACDQSLPSKVADKAKRITVAPGEELKMANPGAAYIIERGALEVTVGDGGKVLFGTGELLNTVGLVGIAHEADPFKPKEDGPPADIDRIKAAAKGVGGAYEVYSPGQAPVQIFGERRGRQNTTVGPLAGEACPDDCLCFYSLCPSAAFKEHPPANAPRMSDWLPVRAVGVQPGTAPATEEDGDARGSDDEDLDEEKEVQLKKEPIDLRSSITGSLELLSEIGRHENPGGGATVLEVTMALVDDVGWALGQKSEQASRLRSSLAVFKERVQVLSNIWRSLVSRCSQVFAGMPPEAMWAIAETVETHFFETDEVIVEEGAMSDDLILIDEGMCIVEKIIADGDRASTIPIGRLGPSALIGDLGMMGSGVPRPASVKAETTVEVLRIPCEGILSVMKRYPGMLEGVFFRLREAGNFLQMRMPVRNEVLACVDIFETSEPHFRNEVAANSSRKLFTVGQIVSSAANEDTIYVLETGECCIETVAGKPVSEVVAPCVFAAGDTLAGKGRFPGCVIRASTPVVMMLVIKAKDLSDALSRHYEKRPSPFNMEGIMSPTMRLDHVVAQAEIFAKCSPAFIEDLCAGVELKGYMPGQTICVKGHQDAAQMIIIRGGTYFTERDGVRKIDGSTVIGDLIMLGATHYRQHTVRAQSVVFTAEIPRTHFLEVIGNYPDERKHLETYALKAIGSVGEEEGGVQWPMHKEAPKRLSYLLNLFAGRRFYEPRDDRLKQLAEKSAVLVVQGKAAIVDEDKETEEIISSGATFNEQILLGLSGGSAAGGGRLELRTSCELQFVPHEIWDKVISEFPSDQRQVFTSIRNCMADKAALKHFGFNCGSREMVRMSRLLHSLSDACVEDLRQYFESLVIEPDDPIVQKTRRDRSLFILLQGSIYVEEGKNKSRKEYPEGKVFGEAEVLGISKVWGSTVKASNLCVLQALRIADFWSVMEEHPEDCELVAPLIEEAAKTEATKLEDRIFDSKIFADLATDFVTVLAEHAEDAFYGPGEAVFMFGEECKFGESSMWILLAGEAVVETDLGVEQARLHAGEVFGEAGALGLAQTRCATVRAPPTGCIHCARLHASSIKEAFQTYPEEIHQFEDMFEGRLQENAEFMKSRNQWLQEQAVPALKQTSLFCKHSDKFLADVAAPLIDMPYKAGQIIAEKASIADSMLVILDGAARVEAQDGRVLGTYKKAAALGEVAALGVFGTRPATIRATTKCRVLVVKAAAIQRALSLPDCTPEEIEGFETLMADRDEQVEHGMPMSCLPIEIPEDDPCARAIALQAQKFTIHTGECFEPLLDDTPEGAAFAVVSEGRGLLELASENPKIRRLGGSDASPAVPVVTMGPGSFLLEGMVAAYGCRLRAQTTMKIFRVRYIDFDVAINLESCSTNWLARFRMLESDTRQLLSHRGGSARGVVDALDPHPETRYLKKYRDRRLKAIVLSKEATLRKETLFYEQPSFDYLDRIPPAKVSPYSSPSSSLRREHSAPELRKSTGKTKGLGSMSPVTAGSSPGGSVRLPKLQKK
mmetsp:Transcript_89265/g.158314  ORF Transcript_89265/g.158314 Transcript_89265/m.158314 type:complete len:1586 (-) Transcript_89265:58-4815(-)|eukprot:CAMPEP_0197627588 /NCGR_PEP_ID=MMETSP1338-20131121/6160_1 /TAXON_ID=43686 ORGANISM="Pelagodinium beii, Strain RCC1491" /NCGR_SAMPLE_ID=MMETSP1338 /ASSEMBLY_ACC=CAM_ASM_000754 /LENGTH=1585 /DNA_ID=CAMNT_0043198343 /DNA_START=49 /DNA_END=4806 /DNA_ORIENTATION=+